MSAKHIHLIGICGTAMASLAGMLQQRGFRVTGSDAAAYPPMSDFLASLNIPLSQPFAAANLDPKPDLVVVGNAISLFGGGNIPRQTRSRFLERVPVAPALVLAICFERIALRGCAAVLHHQTGTEIRASAT